MNLYLYNFAKKKNSTKTPSDTTATIISVHLKEPCDSMHPIFKLERNALYRFNYLKANLHGKDRYYFVDEVTYYEDEIIVRASEDVLATNKTAVTSYNGHIIRTSNAVYYNMNIPDQLNPVTENVNVYRATSDIKTGVALTSLFHQSRTDGSYILTVCGKSQSATVGFSTSYVLTSAQLLALQTAFNDQSFLQQVINEFTNPLESIVSCKFVPIKSADMFKSNTTENIYVGSQDTGVQAYRLTSPQIFGGIDVTLPAAADGYLNAPPYSTYMMYLPFVGMVPLDYEVINAQTTAQANRNKLLAFCIVDVITGDVIYQINEYDTNDTTKVLATFSGNCATDVPVSSIQYSPSSIVSGALATIGGIIGAGLAVSSPAGLLAGIGAAMGGVGLAVHGTETHSQINGSISTALSVEVSTKIHVIVIRKIPAHSITAMAAVEGLPCHLYGNFATAAGVGGFIQFMNASISYGDLFTAEIEAINTFLNTGLFYE